jgi:hypothetical protein
MHDPHSNKIAPQKLFDSNDPSIMAKARAGVTEQAMRMMKKTAKSARQGVAPEVGDQVRVSLAWLDPQINREGRARKSALSQFSD